MSGFFPTFCILTHVWYGGTFDIAQSVVTIDYFNRVYSVYREMPWTVNLCNDLIIKEEKVMDLWRVPDGQTNLKMKVKTDAYAVKLKGDFSWGVYDKKDVTIPDCLALKDIDLSFRKGEFVVVCGSVGSGKTSLLNSLFGNLVYVPKTESQVFDDDEVL